MSSPALPQCPKCEQRALYPKEDDGRLTCAACGHVMVPRYEVVLAAREVMLKRYGGSVERLESHWAAKLREEREKVKRLQEGRW